MSKQTVILATCNLCPPDQPGRPAHEVHYVAINIENNTVGLDLCDPHHAEVKTVLQPIVARGDVLNNKGSQGSGSSRGGPSTSAEREGVDPAAVRAWGRANGYTVPDVGRIGGDLLEAYLAARGQAAATPAAL